MRLNSLLLITFFSALSLTHISYAEENVALDSHLPYVPAAFVEPTQLTPSTELSAQPRAAESTQSANDLWQRIRLGFAMKELDSPLIARHISWYANRPDYMMRMTERAQRYLFYITEEVERRGMPSEIALLPMIESAFNPGAYSIGKASGIWQFIPSTGKNFGMQQNWWYDERRDIITATNGALDYLQKLHDMFDDWELALAAYNWGEGAVSRAQAKCRRLGKGTDYSSLKLPPETQNYVPKLLAIKAIVSDPAKYGLNLAAIPNQPYFAAVATTRAMDVKLAAELAEVTVDEFKALNPSHNRPVILQDTANLLLLPIEKIEIFQTNLDSYDQRLVSWQPYQTKKGEHFDKLAPRFGLSADQLRSINGLSARAKISNGQTLLVPAKDSDDETDGEFAAFNTHLISIDHTAVTNAIKHTVRKGETLATIAKRYRVAPARLSAWNSGVKKIRVGQSLTIMQAPRSARSTRIAKRTHKSTSKLVRHNKPQKQIVAKNTKGSLKVASNR